MKQTHDGSRQKCRGQVHHEPGHAHPERLSRRREDVLVAGDAREAEHIFGGFVLDDVDHVVHGDDADQLVAFFDNGNGEQVIGGDQPRHFFLVHVHTRADRIGRHDALQRRLGRHEQQSPQ